MEQAFKTAWQTLESIADETYTFLPKLILAIVIYWLFSKLGVFVRSLIISICKKARFDITLSHALGTLSSVCINILGILIVAVIVIPDFKLVHIVGGLGITSLVIGFAFKDILQNFLAGLLLLWQKPFGIADIIKTGDLEGAVEEIRVRSTHLRAANGDLIVVPNGNIFANPIIIRKQLPQNTD